MLEFLKLGGGGPDGVTKFRQEHVDRDLSCVCLQNMLLCF